MVYGLRRLGLRPDLGRIVIGPISRIGEWREVKAFGTDTVFVPEGLPIVGRHEVPV
jgi:hypothetical protein